MFKSLSVCSLYILLSVCSVNLWAAQTFKIDGEVLTDPTKPERWSPTQAGPQAEETKFELNYIVVSAGQKRAMVNGKKVLEGDFVSGAKVTRITQNSVHIIYKGAHKELRITKVNGIQRN